MITAAQVRRHLRYERSTGHLWWKIDGPKRRFDKPVGWLHDGYRELRLFHRTHKAQRIIWLIVTGHWPKGEVDHRDLTRDNNRWKNLRDATHAQNQQNGRCYKNNTTGYKGVTWHKEEQKYRAQIQINGKRTILARTKCPIRAHAIYMAAAKQHYGEFARAG